MRRAIPGLLVLLLLQLVLVAAVYRPDLTPFPTDTESPAPVPDMEQVNTIVIIDSEGEQVTLERMGREWRLPALHGLPADPEKVSKLLDALPGAVKEWPVANTTAARQRFEVADYHFRRKIDLFSGETSLQTVYLGTSPGFRKVHSRLAGQDDIRAISFNVHDAPVAEGAWIDPGLIQVRTPTRIDADAYSVRRESDGWRTGIGQEPDQREIQALLSTLRTLRVRGVAGPGVAQVLASAEPELVLDIEALSGNFVLSLIQHDGAYFANSSAFPVFFRISAYDYDRITGIDFLLMSGQGDSTPL